MNTTRTLVRTTLAAVGFCAALGVQGAAAQGFFDSFFSGQREGRSSWGSNSGFGSQPSFLFGGRQSSGGIVDPDDPRLHQEIRRRAEKRSGTLRPSGDGGTGPKQVAVAPTDDAPRGSMAYFVKDKTLRAGDVVVTEKGFMIFQGGDHATQKSFVALGKLGAGRANLVALETASVMRTPNVEVELISAIRDFVGPRTQGQMNQEAELKKLSVTAAR